MSATFPCPNRGLDPTGIRVGQRWEDSTNPPILRDVYQVQSEPDTDGRVSLRLEGSGQVHLVPAGTLLAHWTCLDVPG